SRVGIGEGLDAALHRRSVAPAEVFTVPPVMRRPYGGLGVVVRDLPDEIEVFDGVLRHVGEDGVALNQSLKGHYHIARHRAPQATSTYPLVAFLRPGVRAYHYGNELPLNCHHYERGLLRTAPKSSCYRVARGGVEPPTP